MPRLDSWPRRARTAYRQAKTDLRRKCLFNKSSMQLAINNSSNIFLFCVDRYLHKAKTSYSIFSLEIECNNLENT